MIGGDPLAEIVPGCRAPVVPRGPAWWARAALLILAVAAEVVVLPVAAAPATAPPITIASVEVTFPTHQRNGGSLSSARLNVVLTAGVVAFRVVVRNSGRIDQTHIAVKLVIDRGSRSGPIVKTETLDGLGPGQSKTIPFSHVGTVPFAIQTSVTVELTGGGSRAYPVVFALPD